MLLLPPLDRAAAFAEKDRMQSVSDNIMLGQLCPIGTGSFTLLLDEGRLADAIDVSAGFLYGGSDIDGRGGLTPGASFSRSCLAALVELPVLDPFQSCVVMCCCPFPSAIPRLMGAYSAWQGAHPLRPQAVPRRHKCTRRAQCHRSPAT